MAVGVPEIAPVAGSITRPAGNAGEIVTVTGPLVITGVNGVAAWFTANVIVLGVNTIVGQAGFTVMFTTAVSEQAALLAVTT